MKPLVFLVMFIVFSSAVFAGIPGFLQRHELDPAAASQELPPKGGARYQSLFSPDEIRAKDYVIAKDDFRRSVLCTESRSGELCLDRGRVSLLEQFDEEWLLKGFIGGNYEVNLFKLAVLDQGTVAVVPWSGHYWPIYQGGIGARYGDPKFPNSESFKVNFKYFNKEYLHSPSGDREELGKLSPAEKYDYLLGDKEWNLTRAVWSEGKAFLDSTGKVETWMGICHGWAPASFMVPEPKKAFDLKLGSRQGTIRLYPHDLKALISQLWAQSDFGYDYLGGRCNDKNPKKDSHGRIISTECFDINPSSWHIALTHWVGRMHQSFVLDATYDYEVWNQPISGYKLSYFNPSTREQADLKNSIVSYDSVKKDPYKKYRSPKTSFLVGVVSEIQYVVEELPTQYDSPNDPFARIVTVSYYYDLELDQDYNIVGGEWYQQAHPDMLWKPQPGVYASVRGEENLPDWEGNLPLPQDFFKLGVYGSAQKMPLNKILHKLVEWSLGAR